MAESDSIRKLHTDTDVSVNVSKLSWEHDSRKKVCSFQVSSKCVIIETQNFPKQNINCSYPWYILYGMIFNVNSRYKCM